MPIVNQIMTSSVIYTHPNIPLIKLSAIFDEHNIHHLPVVDADKNLLGILSDRDVDRFLSPFVGKDNEREQDTETAGLLAESVMTASPVTVEAQTRVETASILLLEHNISCVPVTDEDGVLVGIVTWKDILNYYVYSD